MVTKFKENFLQYKRHRHKNVNMDHTQIGKKCQHSFETGCILYQLFYSAVIISDVIFQKSF